MEDTREVSTQTKEERLEQIRNEMLKELDEALSGLRCDYILSAI